MVKNSQMLKGRVIYVDVVAGIMIAWMILGHCSYFSHYSLPFFKYLGFYMPWFFYKSGMFFSNKQQRMLIRKDAFKLLRYFVVYSVLGWFIWSICGLTDNSLDLKDCLIKPIGGFLYAGFIRGNGALWFLLSLFIVRQCSNLLINKKYPLPILSLICYVIAFMLYIFGWYNYSWWFGNVFSGMCFFLLGYCLKEKEKNVYIFVLSTITYGFVFFAYYFGWINKFPYLHMHANNMYSGNYLLFFPVALSGIIMTNNIFRILCKFMRFRVLEYIGSNSIHFYVTHWILLSLLVFVSSFFLKISSSKILFIILIGASILLLPIINEIIKYLRTKDRLSFL